jgi:nucleoside phosphorylase
MNANFLIVAALKDEAAEIAGLLYDRDQEGAYIVGKVRRWKGRGEYTVAIVNLYDGMGALESGPATQGAIADLHPQAVLMTGIAAGFEDSKAVVSLGDLMVPCGIVAYELAKLKGEDEKGPADIQHRGLAWAVSESLWKTAAATAEDPEQPWLAHVTAPHPDGGGASKIHIVTDSILGSGEKIIADQMAEARKWLLDAYPRQALGLEMESCASLRACRYFDTPFLIAKASVDRATVEKDDRWRSYACQLSAGFLLTVLQRYEEPQIGLLLRHIQECRDAAVAVAGRLPHDDFGYKILTATSFEQLRQGIHEPGEKNQDVLVPNDVHPIVVLYGGGGAGKTTILRRLFK